MKLNMPGEKGKAICESDGRVSTTFRYRDVLFSDGSGVARKILVGVCDRCGKVVAIPPQSTPSIKAADSLLAIADRVAKAGVAPMPMQEIDAEVKAVRAARRKRRGARKAR